MEHDGGSHRPMRATTRHCSVRCRHSDPRFVERRRSQLESRVFRKHREILGAFRAGRLEGACGATETDSMRQGSSCHDVAVNLRSRSTSKRSIPTSRGMPSRVTRGKKMDGCASVDPSTAQRLDGLDDTNLRDEKNFKNFYCEACCRGCKRSRWSDYTFSTRIRAARFIERRRAVEAVLMME